MDGETIGIVGAGITGACTANYLSRRSDRRVVVFEPSEVAAETTAKSADVSAFGPATQRHTGRC